MTKEEKRERRRLKHDLQRAALKHHFRQFKLYATEKQLRAAARQVADQVLAGKNPAEVVTLQ